MFKFTPQVWLIILIGVFLGIFLLPEFSIPVEYKAYEWVIPATEETPEKVLNLLTADADQIPENLERREVTKKSAIVWKGLDLSLFGVESSLTNFKKGSEIYPGISYEYKAGALNSEVFDADINLIRRRMDVAGITDVNLVADIQQDSAIIRFEFPANYEKQQARVLSSLFVGTGELRFFENRLDVEQEEETDNVFYQQLLPGFNPTDAQIYTADIENINVVSRTEYFLPVWQLSFKQSSMEKVRATLNRYGIDPDVAANSATQQATNIPIYSIEIDGLPQYVVTYVSGNEFSAIPLGLLTSLGEVRATASYVISSTLVTSNFQYEGDGEPLVVANMYAKEGRAQLAWLVILGAIFGIYAVNRKYGNRGVVAALIAVGFPILLGVSILKLVAEPISIGLLLGVITSLAIVVVFVDMGLRADKSEVDRVRSNLMEISGFIFLTSGLLYLSNAGFADYRDIVSVIAIMGVAILISAWTTWHYIFNWYFADHE